MFFMCFWTGGNSKIEQKPCRVVPTQGFLKMKKKGQRSGFRAIWGAFLGPVWRQTRCFGETDMMSEDTQKKMSFNMKISHLAAKDTHLCACGHIHTQLSKPSISCSVLAERFRGSHDFLNGRLEIKFHKSHHDWYSCRCTDGCGSWCWWEIWTATGLPSQKDAAYTRTLAKVEGLKRLVL